MSENRQTEWRGAPDGRAGEPAPAPQEISLLDLAVGLLRHRKLMIVIIGAGVLASMILALLSPPTYRATARIVPSAALAPSSGIGGISTLQGAASQLGFSLTGPGSNPSLLYPDMLTSPDLLSSIFRRVYPTRDGKTTTLVDYFRVKDADPERALARAVFKYGRKLLRTSFELRTGVTSISADLRDPVLVAAVVNASADELNRYIRTLKTSQAGEKVRFIAKRVTEVQDSLAAAEEDSKAFHERNRVVTSSPELLLMERRLTRRVTLNEQLFITLKTQYEIARIEEVENLPDVLVIDRGTVPMFRSSPRRVRIVILGGILSCVAAVIVVAGLESVRAVRGRLGAA